MNGKRLTVGFAHDTIPECYTDSEKRYYAKKGEWDSQKTLEGIITALERGGSRVIPLEVHPKDCYTFIEELNKRGSEIDIVFNIAEYFGTKNRESIIPAILEGMRIPFTGSDLAALANAMNKATALEIVRTYGVNVAFSCVFGGDDLARLSIKRYARRLEGVFPLIVKPIGEGTSLGMTQRSVVENVDQLQSEVMEMITNYQQPALAQQFFDGKEYTVGIVGNSILPILQIDLKKMPDQPKIRDPDVKDRDSDYLVPVRVSDKYIQLAGQAALAHTVLSCCDYNRLDFREHKDGKIYFLEANPLPGLDPAHSDLPKIARLAGISYDVLINSILFAAVERYRDNGHFTERFTTERVRSVTEFVQPTLRNLDTYPRLKIDVGVDSQPEDNFSASYQLVRVKKS